MSHSAVAAPSEMSVGLEASKTFLRPTGTRERIQLLDVLRGLAVCGILIGNMQWFAGYGFITSDILPQYASASDQVTRFLINFFVQGKFYSVFSFLFGFGFALQMKRAEANGDHSASLFKRRLFWLLVIGLLHAYLLWYGDILTSYALTGFILLLFRRKTDESLLKWALAMLALPILSFTLIYLVYSALVPRGAGGAAAPDLAASAAQWEGVVRMISGGSYAEIIKLNFMGILDSYIGLFYKMRIPKILGMFLLGFYAQRKGFFTDVPAHRPFIRRLMWGVLLPALVGNALLAGTANAEEFFPPSPQGILRAVAFAIGVPSMALFYICAVTLLWEKAALRRWLSHVAPAGRMALSNYLLQTVVCVFIFYGYGLGLFGRLEATAATGVCFVIFLLQVGFSKLWMSRFSYGPVEWVWRQLTYRQRLPLRREQTSAVGAAS